MVKAMAGGWRWIGGHPAYDLSFFVGSGLVCFGLWAFYEAMAPGGHLPSGLTVLTTYFLFSAILDLPHIFQTFSRTHGDPSERRRRPWLYWVGLPLVMASGLLVPYLHLEGPFIAFTALYGSHHIVRQHVGLMRAYQVLNGEGGASFDARLDRLCLELVLYACILHEYAAEAERHTKEVPIYANLHATFPALPPGLVAGVGHVAMGVAAWWLLRQVQRLVEGERLNLPKLLLMGMAAATHVAVFLVAAVPFLVAEAIETAYHDLQYHGWVHRFQRLRFGGTRAMLWAVAAVAFGAVMGTVEALSFLDERAAYLFAPVGMLTLFHYWIDGRIWRLGQDAELRGLMLGTPQAEAEGPTTAVA